MPRNAFILYVERRRRDYETNTGQKLSLEEAVKHFGPEWTEMRAEQRQPFQRQAAKNSDTPKPQPSVSHVVTSNRYSIVASNPATFENRPTVRDLSSFSGESAKTVQEKFENFLDQNPPQSLPNPMLGEDDDYFRTRNWHRFQIHRLCDPTYGEPTQHRFVLIEASIYGQSTNGLTYIPAEIAMAVYSFEEGLVDNFCAFVDPGHPPLGTANVFKDNRLKYGLPVPPFNLDCAHYAEIWDELEEFVTSYPTYGTNSTYLFCREYETKKIRGVLTWLARKAGKIVPWDLLPYGQFMYQMSKFAQHEYFNWLKRQRIFEQISQNDAPSIRSRRSLSRSGFSSCVESDTEGSSSLHYPKSCDSTTAIGSPTPADSIFWSDSEDGGSDDEDMASNVSSAMGLSTCSMRSNISLSSWTAKESSITAPDIDWYNETRNQPDCWTELGDFIPRWSTGGITAFVERFRQLHPYAETQTDVDSTFSMPQGPNKPTETDTPQPLSENVSNFQEWDLFTFEMQADRFFDSLDLASNPELGCPHHMMNNDDMALFLCPLSIVNRNIFNTLDVLLELFHIRPEEGRHYPFSDEMAERHKRRRQVQYYCTCSFQYLPGFKPSAYMTQAEYDRTMEMMSGTGNSRYSSRCSSAMATCSLSDYESDDTAVTPNTNVTATVESEPQTP